MTLRPRPDLAWQELDGSVVIVDLDGRVALGLNASGSLLWRHLCANGREGLERALGEAFGLSAEAAERDVQVFVALLQERGLVVA